MKEFSIHYSFSFYRYASNIFPSSTQLDNTASQATDRKEGRVELDCEAPDWKRLRLSLLQEVAANALQASSSPFQKEIDLYLAIRETGPPLDFWKKHEASFPILSRMAMVYLAVSAGSVSVENLFSTAALILNVKRSSLAPYRSNIICFIHDNYSLINSQ